jgi:hypothetical protein
MAILPDVIVSSVTMAINNSAFQDVSRIEPDEKIENQSPATEGVVQGTNSEAQVYNTEKWANALQSLNMFGFVKTKNISLRL